MFQFLMNFNKKYILILEKKSTTATMENYSNMSNSSHSTEIGGLVYFLTYISDYLPYVILTSVGFVIGLVGTN